MSVNSTHQQNLLRTPARRHCLWLAVLGCLLTFAAGCSNQDDADNADHQPGQEGNHVEPIPSKNYELTVQLEPYGETAEGEIITRYVMTNKNGMQVSLINYGATVTSIMVPDKNGKFENVVLGFDSLDGYLTNTPYFGSICGRYANRIAEGKFTLDGEEYTLAQNSNGHHLHGGNRGFNRVVWNARESMAEDGESVSVKFTYLSPDGEEGYPGNLNVTVEYTLLSQINRLSIDYTATTDKPTPINLTNHCYWNLAGADSGEDVLDHQVQFNCDKLVVVDEELIPTGALRDLVKSPFDFDVPRAIGERIDEVEPPYDHCLTVRDWQEEPAPGEENKPYRVASVVHEESGRSMSMGSTEPGVQFYTGNFLDGSDEVGGYEKHQGFCLEAQHYPDSPNQPHFPSTILRPGEEYRQHTVMEFDLLPPH